MKLQITLLLPFFLLLFGISLVSPVSAQDRPRFVTISSSVSKVVMNPRYPASSTSRPLMVVGNAVKNTVIVSSSPAVTSPRQATYAATTSHVTVANLNSSLKGYTTGDRQIDSFIVNASKRYSVDPLLIFSQMNQESSFKQGATSDKGASGLMQLMPDTAKRMGVTDIYDPQQNIDGGVKYMRQLLDLFNGNTDLALAGYNAGEGAVIKYGYQIPPYSETQDYVRRISSRYDSIKGTVSKQKTHG
jgi:soluble lytic murein transglycosylase-like protein